MTDLALLITNNIDRRWDLVRLARSDSSLVRLDEVRNALLACLTDPTPVIRRSAARILAEAGDQRGITHLAFNCVSVHPVLKIDQHGDRHDLLKLAKQELLPFAGQLDAECVQLLTDDLELSSGARQIELLANASPIMVLPMANRLVDLGTGARVFASAIDGGRSIPNAAQALIDCDAGEDAAMWELKLTGLYRCGPDKSLSYFIYLSDNRSQLFRQAGLSWCSAFLQACIDIWMSKESSRGLEHLWDLASPTRSPGWQVLAGNMESLKNIDPHELPMSVGCRWVRSDTQAMSTPDLIFDNSQIIESKNVLCKNQGERMSHLYRSAPEIFKNSSMRNLFLLNFQPSRVQDTLIVEGFDTMPSEAEVLRLSSEWILDPSKNRVGSAFLESSLPSCA